MRNAIGLSVLALLLSACSGNSSGSSTPPKKDPVLWECTCTAPPQALGTVATLTSDDIDESERCGTTDPANSLEDKHKGWTCEPCDATATLCTKQ